MIRLALLLVAAMTIPRGLPPEVTQEPLPERWTPMRYNAKQLSFWQAQQRFQIVPAGRRSGKTELAKRKLVLKAISFTGFSNGRFVAAAPTRPQAKDIFWEDLKAMVPPALIVGRPSETELKIKLWQGAHIQVLGMDAPERIEGPALDGGVFDEYGNMKPRAWSQNIRPALSTEGRLGWAIFTGVPEGRNHYYRMRNLAIANKSGDWYHNTWKSSEILSPQEIEDAKEDMDRQTFLQEYEADFLNFGGRVYYDFDATKHCGPIRKHYDPRADLIFCFDFNVEPGVAVVLQEIRLSPKEMKQYPGLQSPFTAVIGEVWIPYNSNTPKVCRKLIQDWRSHRGRILCYGDPAGGSRHTQGAEGTDWALIRQYLKAEKAFGRTRVKIRVDKAHPRQKARINAMNTRIWSAADQSHMVVDAQFAPHVVTDLEGVSNVEGGSFEIDKDKDDDLTHLTDALGYYVEKRYPVRGRSLISAPLA